MILTVSNNIRVADPSLELINWCHKNLVISNPDYTKKQRMGFWLGNTPKTLALFEQRDGDLILPYGILSKITPFISKDDEFHMDFAPLHRVSLPKTVPLYDYQEEAVTEMLQAPYGILQAPAGSGKTQMGIALIERKKLKALWLTHTHDLLMQSKARAEQYIDGGIGTITEGKVNIGSAITFATVQTMSKLYLDVYRNEWDVIIVDECHRVAGTPTAVTMFSKVLGALAARHKYGLSATVHRADGLIKATYALLGEVVYSVPREAVAERVMPIVVRPVLTGVPISDECLNTDGTLNYTGMINYLCDHVLRNQVIIEDMRNRCVDSPTLILSDRLAHLETLMSMLPDWMREDAVMISGKMTSKRGKAEREQAIEDMRCGRKKYLFATYSLAKEGLDIPCLEVLYLATPQKDSAVVEQSIGRVARVCEGKLPPTCVDLIDDISYLQRAYKKRLTTYRKCGCVIADFERS